MDQAQFSNLQMQLKRIEDSFKNMQNAYALLHNLLVKQRHEFEEKLTSIVNGTLTAKLPQKLEDLYNTLYFTAKKLHKIEDRLESIEKDRHKEFKLLIKVEEDVPGKEETDPEGILLSKLPERHRTALYLYYVKKDKTTLDEVGKFIGGLSRERVRQSINKGLRLCRNADMDKYVKDLPEGRLKRAIFGG